MTRYFFHIEDGSHVQDDLGVELENITEAKCEAVKLAGQSICDAAGHFWDKEEWKLIARDENGLTLFMLEVVGTEAAAIRT
jgi:hypothetical protein